MIVCAICRCSAPRSDCLYSSSHPRPSHFRPSKMEFTEASVLRSTSVSSRRRIMVPPVLRAYNQLKINVRALPTWRNPVGEGAKRTRDLPCTSKLEAFDISRLGPSMLRTASSIATPAGASQQRAHDANRDFDYNPSFLGSNRRRALYLNSIVFGRVA